MKQERSFFEIETKQEQCFLERNKNDSFWKVEKTRMMLFIMYPYQEQYFLEI